MTRNAGLNHAPTVPRDGKFGRVAWLAILAAALLAAAPATARAHPAHAIYRSSDPAPNQNLKVAPKQVIIHFAEALNPSGSDIVVYDATGKRVSTGPAQVSRNDLKTMSVPMQGSGAEIYLVVWHNVSADDGDPDTGAFNFLVNASAASVQAVTPASDNGGSPTSGMPVWLGILLALLGLAPGAGGAWYATTRGLLGMRRQ